MQEREEMDHFKVLEEKVGVLIANIRSLRDERESLKGKIGEQDKSIADLSRELEGLKEAKGKAKDRVVAILEKIGQLNI
ncbi:cell division protein ZapB [Thermodesulfobacteriota bacterium]